MNAAGDEKDGRKRRQWRIAVIVGGILLTALSARIWLYEEPVERLELDVPGNATFQYQGLIESEDEWRMFMAPEVPLDTGQGILRLVDGSERYVVKGELFIRLDWPPIGKSHVLVSPAPETAWLDVLTADSEGSKMTIGFQSENSFFVPGGWFVVPKENRRELRLLLDSLDARCQAAYEQRQAESQQSNVEHDHGKPPGNPDAEQLN